MKKGATDFYHLLVALELSTHVFLAPSPSKINPLCPVRPPHLSFPWYPLLILALPASLQKEEDTTTSTGDPPRKKPTRLAIGELHYSPVLPELVFPALRGSRKAPKEWA